MPRTGSFSDVEHTAPAAPYPVVGQALGGRRQEGSVTGSHSGITKDFPAADRCVMSTRAKSRAVASSARSESASSFQAIRATDLAEAAQGCVLGAQQAEMGAQPVPHDAVPTQLNELDAGATCEHVHRVGVGRCDVDVTPVGSYRDVIRTRHCGARAAMRILVSETGTVASEQSALRGAIEGGDRAGTVRANIEVATAGPSRSGARTPRSR
jgi:hypothetical protein